MHLESVALSSVSIKPKHLNVFLILPLNFLSFVCVLDYNTLDICHPLHNFNVYLRSYCL